MHSSLRTITFVIGASAAREVDPGDSEAPQPGYQGLQMEILIRIFFYIIIDCFKRDSGCLCGSIRNFLVPPAFIIH